MPTYTVEGAKKWQPELWPGKHEASLTSVCPECRREINMNIQLEDDGPTETELYCHLDGIGAPVTITQDAE